MKTVAIATSNDESTIAGHNLVIELHRYSDLRFVNPEIKKAERKLSLKSLDQLDALDVENTNTYVGKALH